MRATWALALALGLMGCERQAARLSSDEVRVPADEARVSPGTSPSLPLRKRLEMSSSDAWPRSVIASLASNVAERPVENVSRRRSMFLSSGSTPDDAKSNGLCEREST